MKQKNRNVEIPTPNVPVGSVSIEIDKIQKLLANRSILGPIKPSSLLKQEKSNDDLMLTCMIYVSVNSKPDHPPGKPPGNFLKGEFPTLRAQRKCRKSC